MTGGTVLELRGIDKTYGTEANPLPVLRSVDLEVSEGEYIAVVGPSGSGKSTLLNIIGCLDRPTRGTYMLAGRDVSRLDDRDLSRIRNQRLGFVFQSFHLVQHLTVLENVELPLFYARLSRRERRRRSEEVIAQVGLSHRLGHLPSELSGGENQRTAVARALANNPALLLADEPTGNLDSAISKEIMALFDALNRAGRTVVVITHDPGIAAAARRRIALRDGRIESDTRQERSTS
ncbi:MAG: ABC transporter ATP-binding protein [Planctomycetota bacterium]